MPKALELTGKRFGRLEVIRKVGIDKSGGLKWLCKCDCGEQKVILSRSLLRGNTSSCGCLRQETRENFGKIGSAIDKFEGTRVSALNNKIRSDNKSGYKGICKDRKRNKWAVEIRLTGKKIFIGRFEDIEDAIKAREEAEEKYFKPIIEKFKLIESEE